MQLRNPNTPNIVNKLFPPQRRGSLASQTKFWKAVLQHQQLTCIYSGQKLKQDHFSLDHYLPWSFVAHDQLWNLIPVSPEVNSSKSNSLPAEKYFPEFISLQHLALVTNYQTMTKQTWVKFVDSYTCDLNLSAEFLLDHQRLYQAYKLTIQPLTKLAVKQGFSADWEYMQ